jgi:hypothetical protein
MDTASTIVFVVVALGVLLVVAYLPEIDRLLDRMFSQKTILHGMDLRDILLAILSIVLAGLGSALFVLKDIAISLSFALVAVVIIVFIGHLRHKNEYRQQWMTAQWMKELAESFREAIKEDREKTIASLKDVLKQALKEDREEQDNSKRGSQ